MRGESKRYVFNDNAQWSKVARCTACFLREIEIEREDKQGNKHKDNLNDKERDVLSFFITSYDMNALQYKQVEECNVSLSFGDIEKYFHFSRTTAYRVCCCLIKNKLLKCTNKDERSCTNKSAYIPNVKTLQKHMKDYLEKYPEFAI